MAAVDFDASIISTEAAIACAEPATKANKEKPSVGAPLDDMRQEYNPTSMLEAQLRGHGVGVDEPLHTILQQKLLYLGVGHNTANAWARRVKPDLNQKRAWETVLAHIHESLPIRDTRRIEEGGVYAFVGPTGVGKTTTLAKIAARFSLRFGAEKLGLVTMDTYRIAASRTAHSLR